MVYFAADARSVAVNWSDVPRADLRFPPAAVKIMI